MNKASREITKLLGAIRDLINIPRRQHLLVQDSSNWNSLCSALDIVDDSECAIDAYLGGRNNDNVSERYLLIFGVMQALVVQQQAVTQLRTAFHVTRSSQKELDKIRTIRTQSTGHPVRQKNHGAISANFIARATLRKETFNLMTVYGDDREPTFEKINVINLIKKQQTIHGTILSNILGKLRKEEMDHRRKFRRVKLAEIFNKMDYVINKMIEASIGDVPNTIGLAHLEMVTDKIGNFKDGLLTRGIYQVNSAYEYEFGLIEEPLGELHKYFSGSEDSYLNSRTAYIFAFFIEHQFSVLQNIAQNIDESYMEDV